MSAASSSGDSRAAATLFTVGHSNHEFDDFVALLKLHGVTAIGDVRSSPFSKFNPQFNREVLIAALKNVGIAYVFLGKELGARRDEPEVYEKGVAKYERIAKTPGFLAGLERVRAGAVKYRLALMCAEKDPLTCHRMILVCRWLREPGIAIEHIREDGAIETMAAAEERLLLEYFPGGADLFRSREELLEEAYEKQAAEIQYEEDVASEM